MKKSIIAIVLAHQTATVKPIKTFMRLHAQPAQLAVGQCPHRDGRARGGTDIGIALRVPGTDIELDVVGVGMINAIGAFEDDRAATFGATHRPHAW